MKRAERGLVARHAVIVFDGECSFCNGWIDILLRLDKNDTFRFAASQSEVGAALASDSSLLPDKADSILVIEDKQIRLRSDAVLRVLSLLGFPFSLAGILRLIPAGLRDAVYDLIARNRKRWFGKSVVCRIPSVSERHRFL